MLAVVPALHDVQRYVVDVDARAAGHGETLPQAGMKIEGGSPRFYILC